VRSSYTKIGFACKFSEPLADGGVNWVVYGRGSWGSEQALGSFCLFDTCVVSDCPYYVTDDSERTLLGKDR